MAFCNGVQQCCDAITEDRFNDGFDNRKHQQGNALPRRPPNAIKSNSSNLSVALGAQRRKSQISNGSNQGVIKMHNDISKQSNSEMKYDQNQILDNSKKKDQEDSKMSNINQNSP